MSRTDRCGREDRDVGVGRPALWGDGSETPLCANVA
jgi:hypothetical protein